MQNDEFFKNNPSDKIWWKTFTENGVFEFSFDRKTVFNLFADYPWSLTQEQKSIFDRENPQWKDFFKDRQ